MQQVQFFTNVKLAFYKSMISDEHICIAINKKKEEIIKLLFNQIFIIEEIDQENDLQESFIQRFFDWFWSWFGYNARREDDALVPNNNGIEICKQEILDLFLEGNKSKLIYKKLKKLYLMLKNAEYDEIAAKLRDIIYEIDSSLLITEIPVALSLQNGKEVLFDTIDKKLRECLQKKKALIQDLYRNDRQVYVTALFEDPILFREIFLCDISDQDF